MVVATLVLIPFLGHAQTDSDSSCAGYIDADGDCIVTNTPTDNTQDRNTTTQTPADTTDPANPHKADCENLGGGDSCNEATYANCMYDGGTNESCTADKIKAAAAADAANPDLGACEESLSPNDTSGCSNPAYASCIVNGGSDSSCKAAQADALNPDLGACEESLSPNDTSGCSNPAYASCIVNGGSDSSCKAAKADAAAAATTKTTTGSGSASGYKSGSQNNSFYYNALTNPNGQASIPSRAAAQGGIRTATGLAGSAPATSNTSSGGIATLKSPLQGINSVSDLIFTFMKIVSYIAVIFGVLMIMWVGMQLVLAQGKPEEIKKRSNELLWVVVGIGVILGARILITTVINTLQATGTVNPAIITNARNAINGQ